MQRAVGAMVVTCCVASVCLAHEAEPDVFSDAAVGFSIEKPKGWHYISADETARNRDAVRLKNREVQELIKRRPQPRLVTMARHHEPHPELNPSVTVAVKPISNPETFDPVDVLQFMVRPLKGVYDDFKIVEAPKKINLKDREAAYAKMHYTLKSPDDKGFPACTEMWVIPRGENCFIVSAGSSPDPDAPEHAEINKAIESIEIAP